MAKDDLVKCKIKGKQTTCIVNIIDGAIKLRDLNTNDIHAVGKKDITLLGTQLSFLF